jgi:hypothetical protein
MKDTTTTVNVQYFIVCKVITTPQQRDVLRNLVLANEVKASKAIPLQPWTGPDCSGRLRLPDFKTVDT